jgi:hypothetical protein
MRKKIDIKKGDRYGFQSIIEEVEPYVFPSGETKRRFRCICDCGNIRSVNLTGLRNGSIKSCGCKEIIYPHKTHGNTNSVEYRTWADMKSRCYNTKVKNYKNYGGRGIIVCDRWLNSFQNFLEDMGKRPDGYTIDRINVDGNYEPNNVRWATWKEQQNNRRNNLNYTK